MARTETLARYARIAWEPDDLIEVRPIPPHPSRMWVKASKLAEFAENLSIVNQEKVGIYVGILPRDKDGGGKAENALPGRVVWADIDHTDPRDAYRRVKAAGMPEPSMVVSSGHGAHVFWRLKAKAPVLDITRTVKAIAAKIGSDPSVADAARVLRLPGFMNWKEPASEASLVYSSAKEYDLPALEAGLDAATSAAAIPTPTTTGPDAEAPTRAWLYVAKMPGSAAGGRTNQAFHAACVLVRDFRLSAEQALPVLEAWDKAQNRPPIQGDPAYPAGELQKILANAMKHGKKPYGGLIDSPRPMRQAIQEVESVKITKPAGTSSVIASMQAELDRQAAGKKTTMPLPWEGLNTSTRALKPGSLVILAGPTKTGKSYFLGNIALHLHKLGRRWSYLPLEDTRQDFGWRLLAMVEGNYMMVDDDPKTADFRRERMAIHQDLVASMLDHVFENPRLGQKNAAGETVVPAVHFSSVLDWAKAALRESEVVFIDPLSQIEFSARDQVHEESAFVRSLLALCNDTGGVVILAAHAVKRKGNDATLPLTEGDVQGSAMLTRLAHCTLLLDGHEPRRSEIYGWSESGDGITVEHNRTLYVAAARNGGGTRTRIAFSQGTGGPTFLEHGIIIPKRRNQR